MEDLPEKAKVYFLMFMPKVFLAIAIFLICGQIGSLLYSMSRKFAQKSEARRDIFNLLGKTVRVFFLIIGIISALGTIGVNVTALIASLGLTGFALGFALKDALSNLLAGILILIYRPFRRGEHIAVTDLEGVVIDIDLRYTTLENEDKRIIIPNSNLFTNPVTITRPKDSVIPAARSKPLTCA